MEEKMESIAIQGASNFSFSATKIDALESTEYTLVTIVCDISGSVTSFADELLTMIKTIVKACQKSPRADFLMLRVLLFNEQVEEIHGFKMLNSIDPDDYKDLRPSGMTALFDATFSAIGAEITYAKNLISQGFSVNGCVYVITDGADNRSSMTPGEIKKQVIESRKQETIESLLTVLIGINTSNLQTELDRFKKQADITAYIDAGDATPQKLAKLADFVSSSISSTSTCLGTGQQGNQTLTL